MPYITLQEHARLVYLYHKGDNDHADPQWADRFLFNMRRDEVLTQAQYEAIKLEAGEAIQRRLFDAT